MVTVGTTGCKFVGWTFLMRNFLARRVRCPAENGWPSGGEAGQRIARGSLGIYLRSASLSHVRDEERQEQNATGHQQNHEPKSESSVVEHVGTMERCTFHTASGDSSDRCSAGLLSTIEDVGGGAHDRRARRRARSRRI